MPTKKATGRRKPARGRPAGSVRVTDDLAESFKLSAFNRHLIDNTLGVQSGARDLAGMEAWNAYGDERRAGRGRDEARERAARYLGIKPRQLDNRMQHGRAAHESGLAVEYQFLRGQRFVKVGSGHVPMSIDDALLECIRRYGYGDGIRGEDGRVAGLETALRALERRGIVEVRHTTLKARRDRSG